MLQRSGYRRLNKRDNMADQTQCDNCGALLSAEDLFCGECGAPRLVVAAAAEIVALEASAPTENTRLPELLAGEAEPQPVAPGAAAPGSGPGAGISQPPAAASSASGEGWRVVAVLLLGVGVLACLGGLAGFLLVGLIGGETTTALENWLIGALCCLLPVGGAGAILAAVGGTLWYIRLRSR
jgi:hypothetical protein